MAVTEPTSMAAIGWRLVEEITRGSTIRSIVVQFRTQTEILPSSLEVRYATQAAGPSASTEQGNPARRRPAARVTVEARLRTETSVDEGMAASREAGPVPDHKTGSATEA